MLDKEKLTSHIRDIEIKSVMIKNISKVEGVLENYDIRSTDFLDPFQRKILINIIRGIDGISFHEEGGASDAERKLIQIYPDYFEKSDTLEAIQPLKVEGSFKFNSVSHRDYLGSLLGLGITKEKIGDIYVHEDCAYIIADKKISEYIFFNLTKISKESVRLKKINISQIIKNEEKYKEKIVTISSLRADNIIAEIFNLSRAKAQNLISSERLKIDFEPILSNSKEIKEGSLISLRGYGRAIFLEVLNETRKGKIRAKIKIIL